MVGIIAKKVGMTSLYQGNKLLPCTIVETSPCVITQIKHKGRDGYEAVQLGYGEKKVKNTNKPLQGHFKAANTTPRRKLVEFRDFVLADRKEPLALGTLIRAEEIFEEGEYIDVVGTSKGKGFCGVVKRHGFSGVGEQTHGQHNRQRSPGSIGAGSTPSRVFKGMRMAGRSGGKRTKVTNIQVGKILSKENIMVLFGNIPGPKKGYIILGK